MWHPAVLASNQFYDPGFRSFERNVLPVAVQKNMAVFSMKSMSGSGEPIVHGALTPTEAHSYAMSVPECPQQSPVWIR
jgi:uncharacterized protein